MPSGVSFQGLSTNLKTDALVDAILEQQKAPIDRMQARQEKNKLRGSLIRTMRTHLQAMTTNMGILNDALKGRTVSSSDNSQVTATAAGAATGAYDVVVKELATKARLTSPVALSQADASLGGTSTGTPPNDTYDYVITNTAGKKFTVSLALAKNTLSGLRDAINAQSQTFGVNAAIVQGKVGSYQLTLTANETGLAGAVSANGDTLFLKGNGNNALGLSSVDLGTPCQEKAKNAEVAINGIAMERPSNTINDAVEGMTFTLKAKDPNKITNLSVAIDRAGIQAALNDLVAKFNAFYKTHVDNAGSGGALANDFPLRTLIQQTHRTLTGAPSELPESNAFRTLASLGVKTGRDGMLSVDNATLTEAIDKQLPSASTLLNKLESSVKSFTNKISGYSAGGLSSTLNDIDNQNFRLSRQITDAQSRLDKRRSALMLQYSNLEKTVGRLQAMGQSLGGLR